MEFEHLQHFITIAELRNLSRAADILKVTQGTLSRHVADLESELGIHLFTRTGRGVAPTPAGQQFLEHARKLVAGRQAAIDALRDSRAPLVGHVTIGLPPSLGELLSVRFCERLYASFPQAKLTILQGLSEELYGTTVAGRVDIALMRNPPTAPNLVVEQLAKEPLYLLGAKPIGRRHDSVTLAQLAQVPLVFPCVPDVTRPILSALMAQAGLTPHIRIEVSSAPVMLALATAGYGYAVVPMTTRAMVPRIEKASWQSLAPPELVATLSMVTASRAPKTPLFVETVAILRDLVRELMKQRGGTPKNPRK